MSEGVRESGYLGLINKVRHAFVGVYSLLK